MIDRDDIDIDAIKQQLADRKVELEQDAAAAKAGQGTVELDQTREGRLSRMDALQNKAMSEASERRRKQELQRIANTFKRIDEGEFGYCGECGEPIALKRIQIDPTTVLCIGCAQERDR
jgi:DnaK suppressor protein